MSDQQKPKPKIDEHGVGWCPYGLECRYCQPNHITGVYECTFLGNFRVSHCVGNVCVAWAHQLVADHEAIRKGAEAAKGDEKCCDVSVDDLIGGQS